MSEPQTRTGFDHAARERVRAALRRYMQDHRIGTPTLQYRIIEADEPRRREIPLSTLQRFITGSHHTQDHHVALCHAFVSDLPYYGEGRDIAQFGEALFGFVQDQAQGREREALIARLESEFAGTYEAASAHLTLSASDGQPWLIARETARCELNPDKYAERAANELSRRRRAREGVMVLISSCIYIMLRDSLTRQPKLCCLMWWPARSESEAMVLQGETLQPAFMSGLSNIQERVQFVQVAARERA